MDIEDLSLFISTKPRKLKDVRPGAVVDEFCNLIFKTEYYDQDSEGNYVPICYNEAGERFHGNYEKLVYPIGI